MTRLPNADLAIIEPSKITGYLLNEAHRFGGSKARFLMRFGFTSSSPEVLKEALLAHARETDIARTYKDRYGDVFELVGPIASPDGRNPIVRVAWMIRYNEVAPRLVTLVPETRLKRG